METDLENAKCSRCQKPFHCGAQEYSKTEKNVHCWCMELTLSGETKRLLKENYADCLCSDCLKDFDLTKSL